MARKIIGWCLPVGALGLIAVLAMPAQADGVKLLPNDTEVVITLNLKQVWNSKLVKDYNALINQIQGFLNAKIDDNNIVGDIKKSLGIDLFKDVDTTTIGMSEMVQKHKNSLIVLEGKFSPDKFTNTMKKQIKDYPEAVKDMTISDTTVYQVTFPGQDPFFVGMPNKTTLLVAKTKEGITAALSPQGQNLKKEMADLVQNTGKKSLNFYMTGNSLQEAVKQGNNAQAQAIEPFLKDLTGAVLSANVVSDVELQMSFMSKDAAAAQKMTDAANQGLAGLKALVGNNKDPKIEPAIAIMKTLKIQTQGSSMVVEGVIPRKVLDETMKKIENFLP